MDYKWHGKFIIEIISKSCKKDGIAKSYLVHKARVGEMLISVITPLYIGFHDTLLLDENEVEYYLNNVAFDIAKAVWESEGKPKDTDMHIRALRVDMDSLSNRFKIYTDIKLDMDKHRKS